MNKIFSSILNDEFQNSIIISSDSKRTFFEKEHPDNLFFFHSSSFIGLICDLSAIYPVRVVATAVVVATTAVAMVVVAAVVAAMAAAVAVATLAE